MKRFRKYAQWVGPILFLCVLYRLDWQVLLQVCQNLKLFPILAGISTIPLEILFRSDMFKALSRLNVPIPFRTCLKIHLIDLAFSTITPAGIGGFVKLSSVKRATGQRWMECLALVLFDKMLCLITLLLFAAVGVGIVLPRPAVRQVGLVLFLFALSLCGIFLIVWRWYPKGKLLHKVFHGKRFDLWQAFAEIAKRVLNHPQIVGNVFGLSLMSWLCLFFRNYAYARGLSMDVGFSYFLLVWPLVFIVGLLPISISGIGIRELLLIASFRKLGITKEQVVSLSILEIVVFLLLPVTVGLIVYSGERRRFSSGGTHEDLAGP